MASLPTSTRLEEEGPPLGKKTLKRSQPKGRRMHTKEGNNKGRIALEDDDSTPKWTGSRLKIRNTIKDQPLKIHTNCVNTQAILMDYSGATVGYPGMGYPE
jgi:hypothetical protein